jgi:hypothetical protein
MKCVVGLLLLLLSSTVLADDNPAQVQAKVVFGSGTEKAADVEIWIDRAAAKSGSPLVAPQSSWIGLTGDYLRLYTSKQGGFIIGGKVTERNGKFEVEIDACAGLSLDKKVTLRPGERRVVNLTEHPAPDNVFIALEAPLSERAKERVEALKANARTFRLELKYNGEQRKPFYRMTVSVPVIPQLASAPFYRITQINDDDADRIIDHLASEGFLHQAVDPRNSKIGPPTMPGYTLKVATSDIPLYEDVGWGLPLIDRLDALRDALPDAGKKDMDLLLGRLSGLRKQWEADALEARVGGGGSQIRFLKQGEKTIVDITSDFGIDEVTIRRKSDKWPQSILARLHLQGLESFEAAADDFAVRWSVSSTGNQETRTTLVSGKRVTTLDGKSPYFTPVRIVGGNGKIPLKGGYFEVPLPAKLFEENPEEVMLVWIDFHRK